MAVNSTNPHNYLRHRFPERYRKGRGASVTLLTPTFRSAEALFVGIRPKLPNPPDLAVETRPEAPSWESQ